MQPLDSSFFPHKHLLGIDKLSCTDIDFLLNHAQDLLSQKNSSANDVIFSSQKTQINLFYEPSTRTRCSFELAGKKLGMNVLNIALDSSSIKKGETFLDTVLTLEAMKPDVLVLRHPQSGAAAFLAEKISCPIINAGDGINEHPTQALLDALTIKQEKGKISGLTIVICGDILHSRVARSNILLLTKMGASIRVVAPSVFLPSGLESMGIKVHSCLTQALEGADVVMALRLQHERMGHVFFPSLKEYFYTYGIDNKKLALAKNDILVMHPGPINRDVEIDSAIVESSKSVILKQVELGVALRMAVLKSLLNNPSHPKADFPS